MARRAKNKNREYIRISMNEPLLSKEEEQKLIDAWVNENDEEALARIIRSHSRLAISKATDFKHYGLPMSDLIQEGNIGLLEAAKRFDPSKDVRFSTYASWWIRASLQDYVLRNWSIVRTGTTAAQKSLFFNFRRLRAKILTQGKHDELNDFDRDEIAEDLGVKKTEVKKMEARINGHDHSLNATMADDSDTEFIDFLEDEDADPERLAVNNNLNTTRHKFLEKALGNLDEREQIIINKRCLTHDGLTLAELGDELGVSKERIRQLESRALDKIKTTLKSTDFEKSDLI